MRHVGDTKVTQEHVDAYRKAISLGLPKKPAANAAGLSDRTVRHLTLLVEHLEEQGLGPDPDNDREVMAFKIVEAYHEGVAAFTKRNLLLIGNAANGSWQAAAWLLERRLPEDFSKTEKIEGKLETVIPSSEQEQAKQLVDQIKTMVEDLKQCQPPLPGRLLTQT